MQDWQEKLQQLAAWWQTPAGQKLLDIEKHNLAEHLAAAFGYQLVLIADESFASLSNHSRMSQVQRIDPLTENVHSLPDRIDAIIIPHGLSYLPNPHEWLQAINNKLANNGKIIFTAFRYLSYLGLQKIMLTKSTRTLPNENNSVAQLRNALLNNDFSVVDVHRFAAGVVGRKSVNLDRDAQASWYGNLVCVTARKKLLTVKHFETEWKSKAVNTQAAMNSYIGENQQHER